MQQSNKNIVLVIPAIAREGITKLVATQVKVLQELGVHVRLIVLSNLNEELLEELEIKVDRVDILQLHQKDTYLSVRNLLSSLTTLSPIIEFNRQHKNSIAFGHGPYAQFILRLVKLVSFWGGVKIKLIQFFHINQYEQFPLNSFRRIAINTLNKVLARLCDNIHISVSQAVKDDVQRNLIKHNKHVVLYNPVPVQWQEICDSATESLYTMEASTATFKLLLSNRIEYSKGQLFFLDVVERFIKCFQLTPSDFRLIVAGDGAQRDGLLTAIKSKELISFIVYVGLLSGSELAVVLKSTDLVVVPSRFEGFSFTALEALAAGCLVLASDAGGLKEVIKNGETGFLFEAGNAEDCFNKLSYIYQNRSKMLINRERVKDDLKKRFSIQSHKEGLVNILKFV